MQTNQELRKYKEWCYSVLRLDENSPIVLETFNYWLSKISERTSQLKERLKEKQKSSVWLRGSYGQARLKRESYLNGFNQAIDEAIKIMEDSI